MLYSMQNAAPDGGSGRGPGSGFGAVAGVGSTGSVGSAGPPCGAGTPGSMDSTTGASAGAAGCDVSGAGLRLSVKALRAKWIKKKPTQEPPCKMLIVRNQDFNLTGLLSQQGS